MPVLEMVPDHEVVQDDVVQDDDPGMAHRQLVDPAVVVLVVADVEQAERVRRRRAVVDEAEGHMRPVGGAVGLDHEFEPAKGRRGSARAHAGSGG